MEKKDIILFFILLLVVVVLVFLALNIDFLFATPAADEVARNIVQKINKT